MDFHEAANIFPLDEEHLDELAQDIKKNGLKIPIEVMGGLILDGRRRYLACQKAGITPHYREVNSEDPVAYVLSLNLHRRHLTTSQAAMVGARAREWYDRKAKERQQAAGKRGRQMQTGGMANLPHPDTNAGTARDQAAKAVGVSGKSIDYATKVLSNGIPELARAVEEGRMAVSTAAILASEPEEVQREEVNKPKRNRKYKPAGEPEESPAAVGGNGSARRPAVGIQRANDAINILSRIPRNDVNRKQGFRRVTDWIRRNK